MSALYENREYPMAEVERTRALLASAFPGAVFAETDFDYGLSVQAPAMKEGVVLYRPAREGEPSLAISGTPAAIEELRRLSTA